VDYLEEFGVLWIRAIDKLDVRKSPPLHSNVIYVEIAQCFALQFFRLFHLGALHENLIVHQALANAF
jgi:hypothetical protein